MAIILGTGKGNALLAWDTERHLLTVVSVNNDTSLIDRITQEKWAEDKNIPSDVVEHIDYHKALEGRWKGNGMIDPSLREGYSVDVTGHRHFVPAKQSLFGLAAMMKIAKLIDKAMLEALVPYFNE